MKNSDVLRKLENDINDKEKCIKNLKLYNFRNSIIRKILVAGIVIDFALPFAAGGYVVEKGLTLKKDSPFTFDKVIEYASVESVDTSYGLHSEKISYDYSYDEKTIEYSTGWTLNKEGLYERTSTEYKVNKDIDFSDLDKILGMTNEELANLLTITDIKTIKKDALSVDDWIYSCEGVVVINGHQSLDEFIERSETSGEFVGNFIFFAMIALICGLGLSQIKKVFTKDIIKSKLKYSINEHKKVSESDLNKIRRLIKLKQENLRLLKNETADEYQFDLRIDMGSEQSVESANELRTDMDGAEATEEPKVKKLTRVKVLH